MLYELLSKKQQHPQPSSGQAQWQKMILWRSSCYRFFVNTLELTMFFPIEIRLFHDNIFFNVKPSGIYFEGFLFFPSAWVLTGFVFVLFCKKKLKSVKFEVWDLPEPSQSSSRPSPVSPRLLRSSSWAGLGPGRDLGQCGEVTISQVTHIAARSVFGELSPGNLVHVVS